MDKEDYVQKARELLDQPTYRTINNDPTTKYKNKLVNLLKSIKSKGEIDEALYKKLYLTGAGSPKFYGLPKIHKEGKPLRPIVSSIGAASYEVAKELANILKPLVGKSMYHIHNTQDFIQPDQRHQATERSMHGFLWCQGTLHISAHKACHKHHQEAVWGRPRIPKKNNFVCNQHHQTIGVLPEQHLFHFPGQVLWTAEGSCNGIPHSPIVANLYMEKFEQLAINTAPHPPFLEKICGWHLHHPGVTNTRPVFLEHLNSIDQHIQFTSEEAGIDGSIPFLDVLIIPDEEGNLKTTVYRKPTHTDLYLQWDSNHQVSSSTVW